MELIVIIALILAGLILFMVEVVLVPGFSLAGILSACCLLYVNYFAFVELGMGSGLVTMLVSISCYVALFIWFLRSKSIDRLALKKEIDSTVPMSQLEVQVGDYGVAITRLALIGNAEINGKILEVKSVGGFLDEGTSIVVDRIWESVVMVRKADNKEV